MFGFERASLFIINFFISYVSKYFYYKKVKKLCHVILLTQQNTFYFTKFSKTHFILLTIDPLGSATASSQSANLQEQNTFYFIDHQAKS